MGAAIGRFIALTATCLRHAHRFLTQERNILVVFFCSRLLLWAIGWMAASWFAPGPEAVARSPWPWDLFYRWDAVWYAGIATRGYSYTPGILSNVAFFPLVPLLAAVVRGVTGAPIELSGFIVANTALLAAAVLLRRLLQIEYPPPSRIPERAVCLLLFSPVSFFHSAFYTESLFLMLTILVFLFARQRRWFAAGVAGALLTATRANALLIALPIVWEALIEHGRDSLRAGSPQSRGSRWWLLLIPTGLLTYGIYLHLRFGDALAFVHAQATWGRQIAPPWIGIQNSFGHGAPVSALLLFSAVAAVVLCILAAWIRLRISYQLYAVSTVLFLLSSTMSYSNPRLFSAIFPLYVALAVLGDRSPAIAVLSLAGSAMLLGVCLALWTAGYFVV